jgi:hypothetical protein
MKLLRITDPALRRQDTAARLAAGAAAGAVRRAPPRLVSKYTPLSRAGGLRSDPKTQFAQRRPVEPTGMNWPLPRYCNSTPDPWLPQTPPLEVVVDVLGCGLTPHEKMPPLRPLLELL